MILDLEYVDLFKMNTVHLSDKNLKKHDFYAYFEKNAEKCKKS